MRCLRRVKGVTILHKVKNQIEIGTVGSGIECGEEEDRVVEENGRND